MAQKNNDMLFVYFLQTFLIKKFPVNCTSFLHKYIQLYIIIIVFNSEHFDRIYCRFLKIWEIQINQLNFRLLLVKFLRYLNFRAS